MTTPLHREGFAVEGGTCGGDLVAIVQGQPTKRLSPNRGERVRDARRDCGEIVRPSTASRWWVRIGSFNRCMSAFRSLALTVLRLRRIDDEAALGKARPSSLTSWRSSRGQEAYTLTLIILAVQR